MRETLAPKMSHGRDLLGRPYLYWTCLLLVWLPVLAIVSGKFSKVCG